MAEDKLKKQNPEELQDEQLDEVSGGGTIGLISDINKYKYQ